MNDKPGLEPGLFLLEKSAYRRRGTADAFFEAVRCHPLDCAGDLRSALLTHLRGGHHLPSRVGVWVDLRLVVVRRTGRKVGFKYRQREIFPLLSLGQKRASLKGTEGRGLTVQRSYRAISAHVFQDDFPTRMHELTLPRLSPCSLRLWAKTIFDFVSGFGKKPEWFPNS